MKRNLKSSLTALVVPHPPFHPVSFSPSRDVLRHGKRIFHSWDLFSYLGHAWLRGCLGLAWNSTLSLLLFIGFRFPLYSKKKKLKRGLLFLVKYFGSSEKNFIGFQFPRFLQKLSSNGDFLFLDKDLGSSERYKFTRKIKTIINKVAAQTCPWRLIFNIILLLFFLGFARSKATGQEADILVHVHGRRFNLHKVLINRFLWWLGPN